MEPRRKCPRVVGRRRQLQKDTKTDPGEKQNSRAFLDSQGRSISEKNRVEGRLTSEAKRDG